MSTNWNESAVQLNPPEELLKPLVVPIKHLMGPGPSNCSQRVLNSLQNQLIGHLHPEMCKLMDEIKAGLQYAFQTRNRLTLAISASGHGGMEASIGNLLERGESILIVKSGIWGERAEDIANRLGLQVHLLTTKLGKGFNLGELKSALETFTPTAVFMVHSESSTGVVQSLLGVGKLVHEHGSLLIVDTVASLGAEPFFTDAWEIDVVYTGSQKCLGAPPGITPITFSPLAERKIFSRKTKVPVQYWDVTLLGDYWNCFGNSRIYHHTISATLVYGLREALAQLAEETLPVSWLRQAKATEHLHNGLKARGFEFYVTNPKERLKTITAVKIPLGIDGKVVTSYAMERHSVEISGGLGPTAGKIFRIGLMGINATINQVDLVLRVFDGSIKYSKSHL
ncbi:alanine--glyoxylate aminotransferase [Leptopilina heterotoma]|uniref:alanine--glyoxylate aminotransferase n=1 Tax=Leptopilina heterotoma TaxID=63436 RepID=UPI001CAA06A2|nr:alanine--glyoxylate aminotransferase [Leptopilina heterotoma]